MSDKYLSKLLFKNDIKYFLLHPVMLALYVWLAILCFTPNYFEKYKIEIVDYEVRRENDKVFYSDLNGDGKSEIIRSAYHESGNERIPFVLYSDINNKTINEWAFFGDWLFYYNIYFDDFDNNGYEEAYFFTMYNDSLFLFIINLKTTSFGGGNV